MDQRRIKKLLREAAAPDCSVERRNEIQCFLGHATVAMQKNEVYKIDGSEAGILLVCEALYVDIIQNRPELLPTFLPVFALLCGDRDSGSLISEIDWDLV